MKVAGLAKHDPKVFLAGRRLRCSDTETPRSDPTPTNKRTLVSQPPVQPAPPTTGNAPTTQPPWSLAPGDDLSRPQLHAAYGGRIHSRISPSKQTPNVMLFVTPDAPASWFDAWTGTHVHYGGEGGNDGTDQNCLSGNHAVLAHQEEGRALRLFLQSSGGTVRYLGEYRLDTDEPFALAEAPPDTKMSQATRSVIVYRLLPIDGPPSGLPTTARVPKHHEVLRIDPMLTGTIRAVPHEPSSSERAADKMLQRYEASVRWTHRFETASYRIRVARTLIELRAPLLDHTRNELVIARASTAREAVWQATGELMDLARFFAPTPRLLLLLPREPEENLAGYLRDQRVTAVWPSGRNSYCRADL